MKHIFGNHHIIELINCNSLLLKKSSTVENAMLECARISGATIITHNFHQFEPDGVSGVIVIAESHFTIHTWPEFKFAAVDVFVCNDKIDVGAAIDTLKQKLEASEVVISSAKRGY